MARRKVRDVYGNWTWEDTDLDGKEASPKSDADSTRLPKDERLGLNQGDESVKLEWRDYLALMWASLETYLLPIVVFIIILFVLAIVLTHL